MNKLQLTIHAATQAGSLIKSANPKKGFVQKEGRGNFATAADLASEKLIMDLIRKNFPDDRILSEETASEIRDVKNIDRLWIIDPIDGTNNFYHGRNYSAVSIAFAEKGITRIGVVYNPFADDLFIAEYMKGSTLNGKKISVGTEHDLGHSVIATDNAMFGEGTKANLLTLSKLPRMPWVLIRGSAVLVMCDVACGRVDLYYHTALKPWDNAAAFLIAQEAGTTVGNTKGQPVSFTSPEVVMGNEKLVKEFLKEIRVP